MEMTIVIWTMRLRISKFSLERVSNWILINIFLQGSWKRVDVEEILDDI